jgi:hypothetical protein
MVLDIGIDRIEKQASCESGIHSRLFEAITVCFSPFKSAKADYFDWLQ